MHAGRGRTQQDMRGGVALQGCHGDMIRDGRPAESLVTTRTKRPDLKAIAARYLGASCINIGASSYDKACQDYSSLAHLALSHDPTGAHECVR